MKISESQKEIQVPESSLQIALHRLPHHY